MALGGLVEMMTRCLDPKKIIKHNPKAKFTVSWPDGWLGGCVGGWVDMVAESIKTKQSSTLNR